MSAAPYRVLVTGSRDWTEPSFVGSALTPLLAASVALGTGLVLVHGACPTGVDEQANQWGEYHRHRGAPVEIERHRADWQKHGPAAGPIRNARMVELGADACLAFVGPCRSRRCPKKEPHGSHGATDCATAAEQAGIATRWWKTW